MEYNYFNGCQSLKEVNARYLALAKQHHPILGKDPITLFKVRLEYQVAFREPVCAYHQHPEDVQNDVRKYPDVIDKLLGWKLEVMLLGSWTWVQGDTYPHREELITMGFHYEPGKRAWYSRPASCRSANPTPLPFDKIKQLYAPDLAELFKVFKPSF